MEFNESWLFSPLLKYEAAYKSTWASLVGGKESQCRGNMFNLWVRRSPGEGNVNPLQYSCLGNPPDRRACQATVHGVTKESDTTEQLNNNNVYHCRSSGTCLSHLSSVQTLMQVQSHSFISHHSASPLLPAPRLPCGHCYEVSSRSRPHLCNPEAQRS